MTSLLDIAPVTKTVKVGEQEFQVRGVGARGFVDLLQRFPDLRSLLSEEGLAREALIMLAPGAIGAIIAYASNQANNPDAEALAADLPLEVQMDFLEAIVDATFKKGYVPFLARLNSLSATGQARPVVAPTTTAPASTSEPPSSVSSTDTDNPPTESGPTPPENSSAG